MAVHDKDRHSCRAIFLRLGSSGIRRVIINKASGEACPALAGCSRRCQSESSDSLVGAFLHVRARSSRTKPISVWVSRVHVDIDCRLVITPLVITQDPAHDSESESGRLRSATLRAVPGRSRRNQDFGFRVAAQTLVTGLRDIRVEDLADKAFGPKGSVEYAENLDAAVMPATAKPIDATRDDATRNRHEGTPSVEWCG